MDAPQPSARFVRAVAAERAELERHRARLASEARELRVSLDRIELGLADIDERCDLLDRLTGPAEGSREVRGSGSGRSAAGAAGIGAGGGGTGAGGGAGAAAAGGDAGAAGAGGGAAGAAGDAVGAAGASRDGAGPGETGSAGAAETGGAPHRTLLRGPAIREHAVAALVASGRESLHYRRWFELLSAEGLEIAGKDPLAVFLTQITRSPVVRRGARAGVYELDRTAAARLTQTLDRLQRDLGRTASDRTKRARVTAEIGRVERALEEATRVLDHPSRLAAVTA